MARVRGWPRTDRFDLPKSGPATDNAEQDVWSNYDQLQHAPPTLKQVSTRAARPNTWGGGRLHHHAEVRGAAAPSTPEDTPSGVPATGRRGEREAEAELESASEEAGGWRSRKPRRGPDRMFFSFVFSFYFFFWRTGEKAIRKPC